MRVRCTCGNWHEVSPTGLALIVDAFQSGELQTIGHVGVEALCLEEAFSNQRVQQFANRYPGNLIQFKRMGHGKEGLRV